MTCLPPDFLILAAGAGTRARPLSSILPKPLFPLAGKPLIFHILQQFRGFHFNQGWVNICCQKTKMEQSLKSFPELNLIEEKELSGSRIMASIPRQTANPLLVVNGDIFLDIPVEKMMHEMMRCRADAVLLARPQPGTKYKALKHKNHWFRGTEIPETEHTLMYCGVGLFSNILARSVRDTSFFDTLNSHPFKIRLLEYPGLWLDCGEPDLYLESCLRFVREKKLNQNLLISSNAEISTGSSVSRSVVWDQCRITGDSRLERCIVTSGSTITGQNHFEQIILPHRTFNLN